MSRFVAVVHQWFMDSKGFTVQEIEAATHEQAQDKAHALANRLYQPFCRTAVELLHIGSDTLLWPRRFSWRERLTGRLDPLPASTAMDETWTGNPLPESPKVDLSELPDDIRRAAILAFNTAADVPEWGTGEPYLIIGRAMLAATQKAEAMRHSRLFDPATGVAIDEAWISRFAEWNLRTFGPGLRTAGTVDHIRKECREIEANPHDPKEWVDIVLLGINGLVRQGHTPSQIIAEILGKHEVNEGRDWPAWRETDPSKAIEHDRAKDATAAQELPTAEEYIHDAIAHGGILYGEGAGRPLVLLDTDTFVKGISKPAPETKAPDRWLPIEQADRSITAIQNFSEVGVILRNSDRYWVRDEDGRVYEASWTDDRGGYWWDWEGEGPVSPIEFMPHPLDRRFAAATPSPQPHVRGIEELRTSTRLGEAEFLLKRSADKLREAVAYWDKPERPGLWRSNSSVLLDQIDGFLATTEGSYNA